MFNVTENTPEQTQKTAEWLREKGAIVINITNNTVYYKFKSKETVNSKLMTHKLKLTASWDEKEVIEEDFAVTTSDDLTKDELAEEFNKTLIDWLICNTPVRCYWEVQKD
jgi:hypothetical protein